MAAPEPRKLPEVWGVHVFPHTPQEQSQRWLRCVLFLGVMLVEWAIGCALGTCILMAKARGWFARPYMGLHEEEEGAESTEEPTLEQTQRLSHRAVFPCAACSLVLAVCCAAGCQLSRDTGLAWEAWAAWVAYVCGSHLVQTAMLDSSSGAPSHPLNFYAVKTTRALTPVLSDPVDFLKDTTLAALLLQEGCRMQGGFSDLAVVALGALAFGVLYWSAFIYVPDTIDGCGAVLEAHVAVLAADTARELHPATEESSVDGFWLELYKQSSPGKRRIVLSEDLPQFCITLLGMYLKLGLSPFPLISTAISALRLVGSYAAQLPARRHVLPRLAMSLESALAEGNKERSQQLIRQMQEEEPAVLNSLALRVVGGLQWPKVFGLSSVLRVARVLRAHAGGVLALALHPAKPRLFSAGGFDGTTHAWSLATEPEELGLLQGRCGCGDVYALALHPTELLLFSSGADGGVRVWRSDTFKLVRVLVGHSGSVDALALHPARALLFSGSADCCIHVRSCRDPFELIHVLEGHAGRVVSLAAHPAEALFFSGSFDDSIRVWSFEGRAREQEVLRRHTGSVWALAVHAERRLLVSGSFDSTIRLWSLDTLAELQVLQRHKGSVLSLALHPKEPLLFSGSGDRSVRVWSLDTFSEVQVLRRRGGSIRALAVEASGARLFVGSGDGSILVCELAAPDEPEKCRSRDRK